ncbi:hypothetical protein WJX75_006295 [Coccomyxa subellipsoidea]|uniref:FAD-binding FR-type domain-containing protein n=1 Tax=Coccomyxa subellipsoidea TaxID=248742 RepID=A0ABR2YSB6_9CHLO
MQASSLSISTDNDAHRPPHATLTSAIPRITDIRDAEIISIQPITPTVKLFRLHVASGVLPFSPGQWVDFHAPNVAHETAGTRVKLQVGGDFYLSQADLMRPLLFIAGGIGITPIVSMLAHFADHVGL